MEKKVQSYNFRRPDRISTNQIRSLHFVHDRFARNASSSISAYLRTIVEISLESIEQVTYTSLNHQDGKGEDCTDAEPPRERSHRCPRPEQ